MTKQNIRWTLWAFALFYAVLLALLLVGCAGIPREPEIYRLADLTVIYTDEPARYCTTPEAVACYRHLTRTIICKRGDLNSCGHELGHATFGDPNHEKELAP